MTKSKESRVDRFVNSDVFIRPRFRWFYALGAISEGTSQLFAHTNHQAIHDAFDSVGSSAGIGYLAGITAAAVHIARAREGTSASRARKVAIAAGLCTAAAFNFAVQTKTGYQYANWANNPTALEFAGGVAAGALTPALLPSIEESPAANPQLSEFQVLSWKQHPDMDV